jgi:hypothetical protein
MAWIVALGYVENDALGKQADGTTDGNARPERRGKREARKLA